MISFLRHSNIWYSRYILTSNCYKNLHVSLVFTVIRFKCILRLLIFTLIRYIQSCISSLCIFQVKSHPCLSARCQILYISTISAAGDLLYISIDLSFNFNLVLYFTCIFFFLIFISLWSSWLYPMLQFYVRMSMFMYT